MPQAEPEPAVSMLPKEFFDEILPSVGDLAELKLVLFVARLSARSGSGLVEVSDLLSPQILRAVAPSTSPQPAELRLQQSLQRAVANGHLYRLNVRGGDVSRTYVLLATAANRDVVQRIEAGEIPPSEVPKLKGGDTVEVYRPNLFSFYEQNIGPLTPLVAEQLRDAERSYPRAWVEEAMRRALTYNKHSWRYVQTILNEWETVGGPDTGARGRS